jgi:hypothetical protein
MPSPFPVIASYAAQIFSLCVHLTNMVKAEQWLKLRTKPTAAARQPDLASANPSMLCNPEH